MYVMSVFFCLFFGFFVFMLSLSPPAGKTWDSLRYLLETIVLFRIENQFSWILLFEWQKKREKMPDERFLDVLATFHRLI